MLYSHVPNFRTDRTLKTLQLSKRTWPASRFWTTRPLAIVPFRVSFVSLPLQLPFSSRQLVSDITCHPGHDEYLHLSPCQRMGSPSKAGHQTHTTRPSSTSFRSWTLFDSLRTSGGFLGSVASERWPRHGFSYLLPEALGTLGCCDACPVILEFNLRKWEFSISWMGFSRWSGFSATDGCGDLPTSVGPVCLSPCLFAGPAACGFESTYLDTVVCYRHRHTKRVDAYFGRPD